MTLRSRFALPAALALSLMTLGPAFSPPALAQTSMSDPLDARDARRVERMEQVVRELRAIVFQGRDTGRPVVVQPAETDYRLADLDRRLSDLEAVLTRINGQIETSSFELRQATERNAALEAQLTALTERIATLEAYTGAPVGGGGGGGTPPGFGATPAPGASAGGGGGPQADFDRARGLMLSGDYDAAEAAFEGFTANHGGSNLAAEANYWLGKTLVVRGADGEAASAFIAAIRGWPTTAWAPDAVLELSRSLIALERNPEACQTLGELSRRYPNAAPSIKSRATAARTQARCG
ncbi:tol-pal system protein YbgF [Phenylobacterium sp.]|uniref:tol-pal system protein YbgF n=1 Tax=Phenylobacterium sp. TaxID=1871053 RepID=UPI0027315D77|nr:tol-pal system protein YbgF [Phenylobacterium sp.]MDP1618297.1 tol-pal system protein YbgF [Phenylobacterium sp.]MDP1987219.1 tol-pal system protein YbgF [Phenylobacterium sp.]